MKIMINDGFGEMCEDCIHARFNREYGTYDFDCAAGSEVVWDDEEECEVCEFHKHKLTKEEIEEIRAEQIIAERRDNGL